MVAEKGGVMGLVGGKSHELEAMAEQWWVIGLIGGELSERKITAEEQEVVAEERGLGPRWRQVS